MAIIKVKLKVNDKNQIETDLDSSVNEAFNIIDANDYFTRLVPEQLKSKKNKEKRDNGKPVLAGERMPADDYGGEPPYPHAGIHLHFDTRDEIAWFSEQDINFLIDVGPDPELFVAPENVDPKQLLMTEDLHDRKHNPFKDPSIFPLICVNGNEVRSGPLKLGPDGKADPKVKKQKYFKFSVTVLGTEITLDPHIETHDGD